MERNDLRARLRTVMAEAFEISVEALPPMADSDSVEKWDSLGHLMLIESVEAAFGISFSHEETLGLLSEDELLNALAAHTPGAPALVDAV